MIYILSLLIASCLVSHFHLLSIKWRSLKSLLRTEKISRFICCDFIYGHFFPLVFAHVFIWHTLHNTYLHYHPDHLLHSVYCYVMLCCYNMGFAFTSFHLCPALTQRLVNYVQHYSWLPSRIVMVGADFNLVTSVSSLWWQLWQSRRSGDETSSVFHPVFEAY